MSPKRQRKSQVVFCLDILEENVGFKYKSHGDMVNYENHKKRVGRLGLNIK